MNKGKRSDWRHKWGKKGVCVQEWVKTRSSIISRTDPDKEDTFGKDQAWGKKNYLQKTQEKISQRLPLIGVTRLGTLQKEAETRSGGLHEK